jgi:hypothetical protein
MHVAIIDVGKPGKNLGWAIDVYQNAEVRLGMKNRIMRNTRSLIKPRALLVGSFENSVFGLCRCRVTQTPSDLLISQ